MRASLSLAMPALVSASASCGLDRPISDGRLATAGRRAVEWSRFSAMLMAWLHRGQEDAGLARPIAYGRGFRKVTGSCSRLALPVSALGADGLLRRGGARERIVLRHLDAGSSRPLDHHGRARAD